MFYSHQLLSRKAPLGQIWMAATMQAKLNRRILSKINIVDICEQILNPAIPLALRLSGILMGGVVIVYNRKVKLLYEDVNRFMVEINAAWRIATENIDPTLLPKGKSQAKYEAVTMKNDGKELEENFRFSMRLDDLELPETGGWDGTQPYQADPTNITLPDDFPSYIEDDEQCHTFDRIDVFGEGSFPIFNSVDQDFTPPDLPTTLRPTPEEPKVGSSQRLREEEAPRNQEQEYQEKNEERREKENQNVHMNNTEIPRRPKKRARGAATIFDYDITIIPGQQFQSWLQDASDILCTRRSDNSKKKRKTSSIYRPFIKISKLMELPMTGVVYKPDCASSEIWYPPPLLALWRKCLQLPTREVSEKSSLPPQPSSPPPRRGPLSSSQSLHRRISQQEPGSDVSERERLRAEAPLPFDGMSLWDSGTMDNGSDKHSISGSRQTEKETRSWGSNSSSIGKDTMKRKAQSSASGHMNSLEKVMEDYDEEARFQTDYRLKRVSEHGTMDLDVDHLLEETAPTQTPKKAPGMPALSVSRVTHTIVSRLKEHFDTPGANPIESLNNLTYGMDRKNAAKLFYQTCVMASNGFIVADQGQPYGDILISRGPNM
ncbi:sister chromatid cohesion 1 protein 1 [Nymphaea colorata]|nr:sister chromatid cohesion 1 protein 1 [Nymphaea colorata]